MRGLSRYHLIGGAIGLALGLALIELINIITAAIAGVPPA